LLSLVKGKDKNNVFSISNIEKNSVGNADVMLYEQEKPYKFIKKLGEIEYSNIDSPNPKRFATKNTRTNTNFMVIMPFKLNDDSKDKSFIAEYLQLINTYTKHELRLFYDSSKFSGFFMTELVPEEVFGFYNSVPLPKAPKPTSQTNEDADLVMAKIVKLGKLRDITDMQEEKEFYQDKINKLQKLFNILTK
jgi:hypothetical protein